MNVNFTNLRKSAIASYSALTKKLNMSLCTDVDMVRVIVPVEDIRRDMDRLRDSMATLASLYNKDDPDCQVIDVDIPEFAPEE
jgi:hypothetical protein